MSVLLNKDSRVVTQGLGKTGQFHLQGCRDYGTQMVAGVRPGKGGLFGKIDRAVGFQEMTAMKGFNILVGTAQQSRIIQQNFRLVNALCLKIPDGVLPDGTG